jgi:hypothetical protein
MIYARTLAGPSSPPESFRQEESATWPKSWEIKRCSLGYKILGQFITLEKSANKETSVLEVG